MTSDEEEVRVASGDGGGRRHLLSQWPLTCCPVVDRVLSGVQAQVGSRQAERCRQMDRLFAVVESHCQWLSRCCLIFLDEPRL